MRGRKPKPTVLKMIQGNPGRRPFNPHEPTHDPCPIDPPSDFPPAARAEWDRVASMLSNCGQVTAVDRGVLVGYCLKYAQWQALEAEAAQHPFVVKSPSGYPMPNPALGMANKVFALMLKAASELGITPSSRSRVSTNEPQKASVLDKFLKEAK